MAQAIRDVMTEDPTCLPVGASLIDAGAAMRDQEIGTVLVLQDDGKLAGLLTDRDIVVRAIAEGRDPSETKLGDICSETVVTLAPDQPIEEAIALMREHAVRRVPVVADAQPVGIVSIGDLAIERDEQSALADISRAPANI